MKSVILQLDGADFREQLGAIRDWFNAFGFTPLRYDYACDEADDVVRLRLDFTSSQEAKIFCAEFRGELTA